MKVTEKARLEEIREEMLELVAEAERMLRKADHMVYERARAYWIGHIKTALGYADYPTCSPTMETTITELDEVLEIPVA